MILLTIWKEALNAWNVVSEFLKSFIKKSEAILLKQNKTNNNKNGVFANETQWCLYFITLIYTINRKTKSSVRFTKESKKTASGAGIELRGNDVYKIMRAI